MTEFIYGENGVDLKTLSGSGPRGRIIKADVLNAPAFDLVANVEVGGFVFNTSGTIERSGKE